MSLLNIDWKISNYSCSLEPIGAKGKLIYLDFFLVYPLTKLKHAFKVSHSDIKEIKMKLNYVSSQAKAAFNLWWN